jgi:hypothetical protein
MSFIQYPTAADIAEMKAMGIHAASIRVAEDLVARGQALEALCGQISEAFRGVKLGSGVGLMEALGLDDYADGATLARLHAEDEREDWGRIPMESLNDSGLTFTDEEGMRFLLPAYLIAELRGNRIAAGVCFHLCSGLLRFSLLSADQCAAVRSFLLYVAEDPDYEFERGNIVRALEDYWTDVEIASRKVAPPPVQPFP